MLSSDSSSSADLAARRRIVEDQAVTDSLALPRALGAMRTVLLLADVVRGRVKLPRGALGRS